MPRVKVLKGVAHNIGSSFTSLMNYSGDDYTVGHILRFARETRVNTLTIDLLSGQGSPDSLLREPISGLADWYSKMFLRLVQSAGSDRRLIQSATLQLTFDLQRYRPSPLPGELESAYLCDVSIADLRGKEYAVHFEGWWFVERLKFNNPIRPSLRGRRSPLTWLRSWRDVVSRLVS